MSVGDDRIQLIVQSGIRVGPDMQAVFVGHCPGAVSQQALRADNALAETLSERGYAERVLAWQQDAESDEQLYLLPLPIRSLAQLQRLFPDMLLADAVRPEQSRQWLPWAVQDYFGAGQSQADDRLCWVIRVAEPKVQDDAHDEQGLDAFAPGHDAVRHEPLSWNAVDLACSIDSAGLMVLPDFERLLIPREVREPARKRLPNARVDFFPCGADLDDDHRERRYGEEMPPPALDKRPVARIRQIAARLRAWRPDMQWLCSLAPEIQMGLPLPQPTAEIVNWLSGVNSAGDDHSLGQVQFLFPLVSGPGRTLTGASGLVAGHIVHRTRTDGVWRSVAGLSLHRQLTPWPETTRQVRSFLREQIGVGVLYRVASGVQAGLQLDDERIAGHGLFDVRGTPCRSGELVRFFGWLRRALRDLGEEMIFRLDGRDPAIRSVLDAFLNGLFQQGALRGNAAQDAYSILRVGNRSDQIHYRIEIAPSFPIDRFVVTFVHDRLGNDPQWVWEEAANG